MSFVQFFVSEFVFAGNNVSDLWPLYDVYENTWKCGELKLYSPIRRRIQRKKLCLANQCSAFFEQKRESNQTSVTFLHFYISHQRTYMILGNRAGPSAPEVQFGCTVLFLLFLLSLSKA